MRYLLVLFSAREQDHDAHCTLPLGADGQGNEVYGGRDDAVGIFLHRSSDDAVVKGTMDSIEMLMAFHAHCVRATDTGRAFSYQYCVTLRVSI